MRGLTAVAFALLGLELAVGPALGHAQQTALSLNQDLRAEIVENLGALLEDNYIDPELGRRMKEHLRSTLQRGEYSEIHELSAFSDSLTAELQEITGDLHLVVLVDTSGVFSGAGAEPDEEAAEEEEARRMARDRRRNFGFRKTEVLPGNVGYLELHSFRPTEHAGKTAEAAMNFLANTDAFILDLRKNTGGGGSMVELLASYFFGADPVLLGRIYARPTDATMELWTLPEINGERRPEIPLFILTGRKTFSAAEEFCYDLKHLGRAQLVGQPTLGGAHVVGVWPISENLSVRLPYAGAVNPVTGGNWEGVGVQPHVQVPEEEALQTAHAIVLETLIEQSTDLAHRRALEDILEGLTEKR